MLACDVQQRFMHGPGRDTDFHSARCRQVRALGGDCYDSCPLPITAWRCRWRCLRQRSRRSAHDRRCAVLTSDGRLIHRKRPRYATQDSESPCISFVASEPLCDVVLWCLQRSDAHATACECRTHPAVLILVPVFFVMMKEHALQKRCLHAKNRITDQTQPIKPETLGHHRKRS